VVAGDIKLIVVVIVGLNVSAAKDGRHSVADPAICVGEGDGVPTYVFGQKICAPWTEISKFTQLVKKIQ